MPVRPQVPRESSGQVTAACHLGQRPLGVMQLPLGGSSCGLRVWLAALGRGRRLRAWRRGAGVGSEASLAPTGQTPCSGGWQFPPGAQVIPVEDQEPRGG